MIPIKELENRTIIKRSVIIGVCLGIISFFLMDNGATFVRGIAFSLIYSLLSFRLLELTLRKSVKMHPEAAKKYVFSQYSIRYLLTGVVVYISLTNPKINIVGTIIGLFILKIVIVLSSIVSKKKEANEVNNVEGGDIFGRRS
ncbi:ATP synthase subunit I [Alkalibaculum bacchi]|uniref:ATP synthase subunit I n=1 Tax=Alkalibaculum bacchi TaxID=645887 RepID=UPI0026F1796A|nr:ATP synthase subunit I [Alkalibaculum bacchi]